MTAKYIDSSQISQSVTSGASVSAWACSLVRAANRSNSFAWRQAWKSWGCPSYLQSYSLGTRSAMGVGSGVDPFLMPPLKGPGHLVLSALCSPHSHHNVGGPCPPKASRCPHPHVKYRSRAVCVQGVCTSPPGRRAGSTHWYFSILLLAGCWLPQWELFGGLKPRSVLTWPTLLCQEPPLRQQQRHFLQPHSHLYFHFSLPAGQPASR